MFFYGGRSQLLESVGHTLLCEYDFLILLTKLTCFIQFYQQLACKSHSNTIRLFSLFCVCSTEEIPIL